MPSQFLLASESWIASEPVRAFALGIVQGLTEFLPVSSSGHIELANYVMGNLSGTSPDRLVAGNLDPVATEARSDKKNVAMAVVLHFATALSTVVVFRDELKSILRGLFQSKDQSEFQFCMKIVCSMIPAALVGVLLESQIESLFSGQLLLVGSMLIATGVLLLLADRAQVTDKAVSWVDAIVIGVAQAIAILPGVSRSGATISTSVLLGIDRAEAARFSFLMVVPLIFGKMGYDILKTMIRQEPLFDGESISVLAIGFVAAFVTGVLACTWMIKLVKACQLYWFSIYCFVVAGLAIAESYFGLLR